MACHSGALASSQIRDRPGGNGKFFSRSSFSFPLLIITPPLLHIFLSPLPAVCDSVGKAALYLTLSL